jgi:hypothetical protein
MDALRQELAAERAERRRLAALVEELVRARIATDTELSEARSARRRRNARHQDVLRASSKTSTEPLPLLEGSPSLPAPIPPPPISSPSPSFSPSAKVSKASGAKPERPTDPRHAPLVKALVEIGYPFHGGKDAKAVSALLAIADQQPNTRGDAAVREVVSRARIGWAQRGAYYGSASLSELLSKWGGLERPTDRSGVGGFVRTGPDPNGGVGRPGVSECAGCGVAGEGGTVGDPAVWLGYGCGCQGAFSIAMDRDGFNYREAAAWAKERRDAG